MNSQTYPYQIGYIMNYPSVNNLTFQNATVTQPVTVINVFSWSTLNGYPLLYNPMATVPSSSSQSITYEKINGLSDLNLTALNLEELPSEFLTALPPGYISPSSVAN